MGRQIDFRYEQEDLSLGITGKNPLHDVKIDFGLARPRHAEQKEGAVAGSRRDGLHRRTLFVVERGLRPCLACGFRQLLQLFELVLMPHAGNAAEEDGKRRHGRLAP